MPYKDAEKKREAYRRYREANLEKERERKRLYMASVYPTEKIQAAVVRWRLKNPDWLESRRTEYANRASIWARENPGRANARTRKYQLRKKQACPEWADHDAITAVYVEAARLTLETGIPHEVDHIIPLNGRTVSGLHVACNLRVVPAAENRRKSNKVTTV